MPSPNHFSFLKTESNTSPIATSGSRLSVEEDMYR